MHAKIIDGKAIAVSIQQELAKRVAALVPKLGRKPGLAVILVGENPASKVYVKSKSKNAKSLGFETFDLNLPDTVSDADLQSNIQKFNDNPKVDGILLQLPLPRSLNELAALQSIDPRLDVDGLHPVNQGLLLRGAPCPIPCTPKGALRLIDYARSILGLQPSLEGLRAVVVGRSVLVGKPMELLLLQRNCTVTVCHSKTSDLKDECRRADILVTAIGQPHLIGADHVKPGAIVIDIGINRTGDGKLVGDVDFEAVEKVAGALTPVPGGVGPMTIAMLLENTLESAAKRLLAAQHS